MQHAPNTPPPPPPPTPPTTSSSEDSRSLHMNDLGTTSSGYKTQLDRGRSKKGGKIVRPPPSKKKMPRGASWNDEHRCKIPLDRGGKNMPRYMQETKLSKTKLAYKAHDQESAQYSRNEKRASETHKINTVELHRQLAAKVQHLKVQRHEWLRRDKALDLNLEHAKNDLEELEKIALDDTQETTRARMEREFIEYKTDMEKRIEQATLISETIADDIEFGQSEHVVRMNAMNKEHRRFVEEKKVVLAALSDDLLTAKVRNENFLAEHSNAIREAEEDKLMAEVEADRVYAAGTGLRQALIEEGGKHLHEAKLYNANQFHENSEKYHSIIAHLQMETEQLSSSLAAATAERDALMEESKMYNSSGTAE